MKGVFKKYNWLFEWIGAAILIAVGVVAVLSAAFVLTATGVLLVIFGLFRIIPLFKTTEDKIMKIILPTEIVLMVVIGVFLVYLSQQEGDTGSLYGYLIGGVLYLRGFVYFFGTVLRKENTDVSKFLAHIIFITVGTWSIALGGFTTIQMGFVLLAIALFAGIVLTFYGFNNYKKYRFEEAAKAKTKKIEVPKEKELELPSEEKEEITDPIPDNIIVPEPEKEEDKKDEAVLH